MQENKGTVVMAYRIMLANFILLWWNLICMCGYASGSDNSSKFQAVFFSAAYVLFGMPGCFYMWYRIIYLACISRRASYFFIAIGTFAVSTLYWLVACCGFPGTYQAGMWVMLEQFANGSDGAYRFTGFACLVQFALEIALTIANCYLLLRLRGHYTSSGGNSAAQGDAAEMAANDPNVRSAAINAAQNKL